MKDLLDFLRELDVQHIVSMIIVMWYFTRDIKAELKAQGTRIDKMYDHIYDIQKEIREFQKSTDQKFYDMLKEKTMRPENKL